MVGVDLTAVALVSIPGSRGIRFVDQARLFFPEEHPEIIIEGARNRWRA